MPKYQVEFEERVTYVVTFETDDPVDFSDDGEEEWFSKMDAAKPDWCRCDCDGIAVNDRELVSWSEIKPEVKA